MAVFILILTDGILFLSFERKGEILSLIKLTPVHALHLVNYLKRHNVISDDSSLPTTLIDVKKLRD
jgi:hypothetical protein